MTIPVQPLRSYKSVLSLAGESSVLPPVGETISAARDHVLWWFSNGLATPGDLLGLIAVYDDDRWRNFLAEPVCRYLNQRLVGSSVLEWSVTYGEVINRLGDSWLRLTGLPEELAFVKSHVKGTAEPTSSVHFWLKLLLGNVEPAGFTKTVCSLLEDGKITFRDMPISGYIDVCTKLQKDVPTLTSEQYRKLAAHIAVTAFSDSSGTYPPKTTGLGRTFNSLFSQSQHCELMRWACLGLINHENWIKTATYTLCIGDRELFSNYRREMLPWFIRQTDILLDCYIAEHAASSKKYGKHLPSGWLEFWLCPGNDGPYMSRQDLARHLQGMQAGKVVLKILKPSWQVYLDIADTLSLGMVETIAFCNASENNHGKQTAPLPALPSSLS